MYKLNIHHPDIGNQVARFRWSIEPGTTLYRECCFHLTFPPDVPIRRISMALWWRIALICLHSHWNFLRPCTIRLPIQLPRGEAEFWLRLLDAEASTLDAYRGMAVPTRQISIIDQGPALEAPRPIFDTARCATAFSGGKDSLLQVGLLSEFTDQPLLVATTAPMVGFEDHLTPRRRHVFHEIIRQGLQLVEVQSDYRGQWNNTFAHDLGYRISINEVTDTFLYFSSMLAGAAALGATHLFLASEAEVQQNELVNGYVVQHPHFMYSTVTQRALQALLGGFGIRYTSLTSPLHSYQVQNLLWMRYPKLRGLQYSCWRVKSHESACNQCVQCLRIAMSALALGYDPAAMGIDLVTLLQKTRDWSPQAMCELADRSLPADIVRSQLHAQLVRAIQATPTTRVARALAIPKPWRLISRQGLRALGAYGNMRRRLASHNAGRQPGYRAGFLTQLDPLMRNRITDVYATHFEEEDAAKYFDILERGNALATWITEPLGEAALPIVRYGA
jgi:hypothetical protein